MPFIGFVWFASCFSCFLPSGQTVLGWPEPVDPNGSATAVSFAAAPTHKQAQPIITEFDLPLAASADIHELLPIGTYLGAQLNLPSIAWPQLFTAAANTPTSAFPFHPQQFGQIAQTLVSPLMEATKPKEARDDLSDRILPPLQSLADASRKTESESLSLLSSVAIAQTEQGSFEIWLDGHAIAEMPDRMRAKLFADSLVRLLEDPKFEPTELHPAIAADMSVGRAGNYVLFAIDEPVQEYFKQDSFRLALSWINNLRQALDVAPIAIVDSQVSQRRLNHTGENIQGLASWYGPAFHGRPTATGEAFNQHDLTAAHPSLPFGTHLQVTNLNNGKQVIVRVNDRGPYISGRSLDLSLGAARHLGSEDVGVIPFEAKVLQPMSDNRQTSAAPDKSSPTS